VPSQAFPEEETLFEHNLHKKLSINVPSALFSADTPTFPQQCSLDPPKISFGQLLLETPLRPIAPCPKHCLIFSSCRRGTHATITLETYTRSCSPHPTHPPCTIQSWFLLHSACDGFEFSLSRPPTWATLVRWRIDSLYGCTLHGERCQLCGIWESSCERHGYRRRRWWGLLGRGRRQSPARKY